MILQVVRIIVEKHIHLCRYEDLVTARILAEDYKYMDIERLLLGARTRSLDFLLNLSLVSSRSLRFAEDLWSVSQIL